MIFPMEFPLFLLFLPIYIWSVDKEGVGGL